MGWVGLDIISFNFNCKKNILSHGEGRSLSGNPLPTPNPKDPPPNLPHNTTIGEWVGAGHMFWSKPVPTLLLQSRTGTVFYYTCFFWFGKTLFVVIIYNIASRFSHRSCVLQTAKAWYKSDRVVGRTQAIWSKSTKHHGFSFGRLGFAYFRS